MNIVVHGRLFILYSILDACLGSVQAGGTL